MKKFNYNLMSVIRKLAVAASLLTTVCTTVFADNFPAAPKTIREFAKVWDYVAENDVDQIELRYENVEDTYMYINFLNDLDVIEKKYRYMYPEKFNYFTWKDYTVTMGDDNDFTILLNFDDISDNVKREYRKIAMEKAQEMYEEVTEDFTDDMTEADRVMAFCQAIADRVEYKNDNTDLCHTAYCGLVNGYAVCDGYTSILNMLLRLDGIECEGRLGDAGGLHEWTYAKIDGKWLNVDATWFDTGCSTMYAGLTDEEISVTHTPDLTYKRKCEGYIVIGEAIMETVATIDPPIMTIDPPIMNP